MTTNQQTDPLSTLIRHMILADPEKWPHREAALSYIYCEADNGLEWREGQILPKKGSLTDVFGPADNEVPDVKHRMKEVLKRERETFKRAAEQFKANPDGSINWHQKFHELEWEMAPFARPAPDSLFLTMPDRVHWSWNDGTLEVRQAIFERYIEEYQEFERMSDEARARFQAERMETALADYAGSGLITTWLSMETALRMQNYEHLERCVFDNPRPNRFEERVYAEFIDRLWKMTREERAVVEPSHFLKLLKERKEQDPLTPIHRDLEEVQQAIKAFQREVWEAGLQSYYREATYTGHGGTVNGVSLLMLGSAGRVLVTLQEEGANDPSDYSITLIGSDFEEQTNVGLQGIQAPADVAVRLVRAVCEVGHGVVEHIARNDQVSFA